MRCFFVFLLVLGCFANDPAAQTDETLYEVSVGKYLMGTKVETTARHGDIAACKQALFLAYREMERVENLLSSHIDESEISQINHAAGVHPVKVSAETFGIVQRAVSYSKRFDALFDVTIGPLSDLWGFSHDRTVVLPDSADIDACRKRVDYRQVVLDSLQSTVYLRGTGARLDLGGIAKGYAIDRGVVVLRQQNIRHFLLNAGGDIYVSGQKDAQTDWRVGIKHPRQMDRLVARFDLRDFAVATSGDYERYEIIQGKRYHHILDPRTGYPGTLSESATVLAPTAEEADVLATYAFLLGYEAALKRHKPTAPFLLVASDGTVHYNDAFAHLAHFEVMDGDVSE